MIKNGFVEAYLSLCSSFMFVNSGILQSLSNYNEGYTYYLFDLGNYKSEDNDHETRLRTGRLVGWLVGWLAGWSVDPLLIFFSLFFSSHHFFLPPPSSPLIYLSLSFPFFSLSLSPPFSLSLAPSLSLSADEFRLRSRLEQKMKICRWWSIL